MRVYYLTTTQFALSNIALRRVKLARFNDLNDPFELLAVDVASEDLRTGIRAMKSQVNSSEGLLCFSREWNEPLLWSHYGEKHKGIALGFDVPDRRLERVRYIKGMRKLNVLSEHTSQETIKKFLTRLRFTKFDGWTYEKEERQFFTLDQLKPLSGLYFVPFSNELELREVILGPRCDIPIGDMRNLVKGFSSKVNVIKARIAYTKFKIIKNREFRENAEKIIETMAIQIAKLLDGEDSKNVLRKIVGLGKAAIRTHRKIPAFPGLIEALNFECKNYADGNGSAKKTLAAYKALRKAGGVT